MPGRAQVVVVLLLCTGLVAVIGRYYRRSHRDAGSWVIKRADLKMSNPPVVLGRGTYGLVVKARALPLPMPACAPAPPWDLSFVSRRFVVAKRLARSRREGISERRQRSFTSGSFRSGRVGSD